jgi:hypothetical protein
VRKTDTVTFNTPHEKVNGDDNVVVIHVFRSYYQITQGYNFINNLDQNTQNPQTPAGFTQWTVVGSECDQVANEPGNPDGAAGAIAMQARHAIMYSQSDSTTCYSHTAALGDSSTANDAWLYSCDTNDPTGKPCGTDYQDLVNNWIQEINTGAHGLQTLYEAVGQ